MKPSELKYITQEIIDKGGFNVTSPEMFEEARQYNSDVVVNAAKRTRVHTVTGLWLVLQYGFVIIFVCMKLFMLNMADLSNIAGGFFSQVSTYAMLIGGAIGVIAFFILFSYFVILRDNREPRIMAVTSLPLVAAGLTFVIFPLVNFLIGMLYTKTENKLSEEAGYPAFVRLNVTTIESEADSIQNLTYESIKERAKRKLPGNDEFL